VVGYTILVDVAMSVQWVDNTACIVRQASKQPDFDG